MGANDVNLRFTEEEFYNKLKEFITIRLNEIEQTNFGEELTEIINNDLSKYKCLKNPRYEDALNIIIKDVEEWSRFSLDINVPEREIIFRVLLNKIYDKDFVCLLYEDRNPNLSDDAWKEISFILSDIFSFENWDDEHVDFIYKKCMEYKNNHTNYNPLEDEELIKYFGKVKVTSNTIKRIYWPHITEPDYDEYDESYNNEEEDSWY